MTRNERVRLGRSMALTAVIVIAVSAPHHSSGFPPPQTVETSPVLGKVLPVSDRTQHQRPTPPRRCIGMRRLRHALFVPDDVAVIVEEVGDAAPPSEPVVRDEYGDVSDRADRANNRDGADYLIRHRWRRVKRSCGPAHQDIDDKSHHQQESDRRDVEFAAKAKPQCNANPRQNPPASLQPTSLREFEEQQVSDGRARDIDDVDHGDARIDEEHAVANDEPAGQRPRQPRATHAAREQVGHADQRRADTRIADSPTPRMVAEQPDARGDHQLCERRMRIEKRLAVQVVPPLRQRNVLRRKRFRPDARDARIA